MGGQALGWWVIFAAGILAAWCLLCAVALAVYVLAARATARRHPQGRYREDL